MFAKHHSIRKTSSMPFEQLPSYFLSRFQKSFKSILFIFIFILFLTFLLFRTQKHSLCDPAQHLYWFCPWPDPQTTVCSWDEHFPLTNQQNRSPDSYEELFLSLPKLRPSFLFNNSTLRKCSESSLDVVLFVISKCSHGSIRQSIRRTWGNTKVLEKLFGREMKLKLLFLLDLDSSSKEKVQLEHLYHEDLVQVLNLPEQYEYVTEREAALYQFISERCQQTKFVLKTDDDIFLNTLSFVFLKDSLQSWRQQSKYVLFGVPIEYGLVVRHSFDTVGERYIITRDEYSCPRYPTFLSGFGYLMSLELSQLFFYAYQTDRQPFPLSDVYFTGLLTEMMNIPRHFPSSKFLLRFQSKCDEQFFSSNKIPFACAASNDHFNLIQSNKDRTLMNDYNRFWTRLMERYDELRSLNR